jgi:hypothetical protein
MIEAGLNTHEPDPGRRVNPLQWVLAPALLTGIGQVIADGLDGVPGGQPVPREVVVVSVLVNDRLRPRIGGKYTMK